MTLINDRLDKLEELAADPLDRVACTMMHCDNDVEESVYALLLWCNDSLKVARVDLKSQSDGIDHLQKENDHLRTLSASFEKKAEDVQGELKASKQRVAEFDELTDSLNRGLKCCADQRTELHRKIHRLEDAAPEWTPVSEPPTEAGMHLITDKSGRVYESNWDEWNGPGAFSWSRAYVIAWRPMPEPYRPPEPEVIRQPLVDRCVAELREFAENADGATVLTMMGWELQALFAQIDKSGTDAIVACPLTNMTDVERMEVMSNYCKYCGRDDPHCQCWNDE